MIKKLFVLNMKVLLSGVLKWNSGKKQSNMGKTAFTVFIGIVVASSLFSMFYFWFNTMCEPYFAAGIGYMYFSLLAVTVFALCVISAIFTSAAVVFGAKDNELLLSMPIKPSAILISRLSVLFTAEYAITFLAALAAFIPWVAGGYATGLGILFFVAGVIFLPLCALSLALLLAWVLALVSSRLRYKNIITLVISVVFLVGYLYVYMNMQSYLGELVAKGSELAEAFRKAMPPFYAFGVSVANGDVVSGLTFVLWAVAPFAVALLLLASNYNKILTTNKGSLKVVYHEKRVAAKGVLSTLVGKEMAKFWSKPIVIMNSSIGSLFLIISPIILFKQTSILVQLEAVAPMVNAAPVTLIAAVLAFLGVSNSLSASLVSLEGKNLWIAKSVPVSPQAVLRAKIITHLLSASIPCLFAAICFGFALAGGLADWLLLLILPQTAIFASAVLGLTLNLHFPKLDWTNEIYVVKQSVSAMLMLFGSWGVLIALGLLYAFELSGILSIIAYLWFCGLIFVVAGACVYLWLMKRGAKKFVEL